MRGGDSRDFLCVLAYNDLFPTPVGMTLMKAKKRTFAFNFPTQVGLFLFEIVLTDDRNAVMT